MNFLTSFRIFSTPRLTKFAMLLAFTDKTFQRVSIDLYSSKFLTYAPSLILGRLLLK